MAAAISKISEGRRDIFHVDVDNLGFDPEFDFRDPKNLDIDELAEKIAANGYDSAFPIKVARKPDGSFTVVDGRRRFRASRLARQKFGFDGLVWAVVSQAQAAKDILLTTLSSNYGGKPFSALEESRYFDRLHKEGVKYADIAAQIGKSIGYVQQRLDLLKVSKLDSELEKYIVSGVLSATAASQIAKLNSVKRKDALEKLKSKHNDIKSNNNSAKRNKDRVKVRDLQEKPTVISGRVFNATLEILRKEYANGRAFDALEVLEYINKGQVFPT